MCKNVRSYSPWWRLKRHPLSILSKKTFPELQYLREQNGYIETWKGQGIMKPSHYALAKMNKRPLHKTYKYLLFANLSCIVFISPLQFSWHFHDIWGKKWGTKACIRNHPAPPIPLLKKKKRKKKWNKITEVLEKEILLGWSNFVTSGLFINSIWSCSCYILMIHSLNGVPKH